jgi:tetratricopeptide (TPR) repeat protein
MNNFIIHNYLLINIIIRFFSVFYFILDNILFYKNNSNYNYLFFVILFIWFLISGVIFHYRKYKLFILLGVVDVVLGSVILYFSSSAGLFLALLVPISLAITYLRAISNFYFIIIIGLVLIGNVLGSIGLIQKLGDPTFNYLLPTFFLNIFLILFAIFLLIRLNSISKYFITQSSSLIEEREVLQENISLLEQKINDYQREISNLKQELEQEKIAFNVELEKIVKDSQMRKGEVYNQIKALTNELTIKDKLINDLNTEIENLKFTISEDYKKSELLLNILFDIFDMIKNFNNLYKVSDEIINFVSKYINFSTFVLFIKSDTTIKIEPFIIYGENYEFYYNYNKIEMEDLFNYVYNNNSIVIIEEEKEYIDRVLLTPFYPKEKSVAAIPLTFGEKPIGLIYLSSLEPKTITKDKQEILAYIGLAISIIIFASLSYNKTISRVLWDERLNCYSASFFWEILNTQFFISKRYNENSAILFIKISDISSPDIDNLSDYEIKIIKEINGVIRNTIRVTDIISYIGNGIIVVLLIKIDSTKTKEVVTRIVNNINIKLKTIAPDKVIKFQVADFLNYNKDVSTIVEELFNKVSI